VRLVQIYGLKIGKGHCFINSSGGDMEKNTVVIIENEFQWDSLQKILFLYTPYRWRFSRNTSLRYTEAYIDKDGKSGISLYKGSNSLGYETLDFYKKNNRIYDIISYNEYINSLKGINLHNLLGWKVV